MVSKGFRELSFRKKEFFGRGVEVAAAFKAAMWLEVF
jgi:hypothetical protein